MKCNHDQLVKVDGKIFCGACDALLFEPGGIDLLKSEPQPASEDSAPDQNAAKSKSRENDSDVDHKPAVRSEGREWTLWRYKGCWNVVRNFDTNIEEARKVRVIEKSAFDELKRENEELKQYGEKPCPTCGDYFSSNEKLQARIETTEQCLLQMQDAAIELTAKLEKAREALLKAKQYIPHTPQDYSYGMGGANHSPCASDCPKCACDRLFAEETK